MNNCSDFGITTILLDEYMSAFKADSSNLKVALMLGMTFTHMVCHKFSTIKHSLVVQTCSFLKYYKSLLIYYKKGLEMESSIKQGEWKEGHNMFDLIRETAFNMSLFTPAQETRMYTEKYLTVSYKRLF